jgi:hypothetical protein
MFLFRFLRSPCECCNHFLFYLGCFLKDGCYHTGLFNNLQQEVAYRRLLKSNNVYENRLYLKIFVCQFVVLKKLLHTEAAY